MGRRLLFTIVVLGAAAAVSLGTAAVASAAEVILQNDNFSGSASGTGATPELSLGEGYAVRFSAPEYPVELHKIQGLFINDSGTPGTACGLFYIRVYEDDDGLEPGALLYDSDANGAGVSFEFFGSESAMQELWFTDPSQRVDGFPLHINGDFRVMLVAAERTCVMHTGNGKFPLVAVDAVIQPGRNFLWGNPGVGTMSWFDTQTVGASGDFIIRAVVETAGTVPPIDIGSPDVAEGEPDAGEGGVDIVQPEPDLSQPEPDLSQPEPDLSQPQGDAGGSAGGDSVAAGTDVVAGGALKITDVLPDSGVNTDWIQVQILGTGFQTGLKAFLDADELTVTEVTGLSFLAMVPPDLTPGVKTLVVRNPDGAIAKVDGGFTVLAAGAGAEGSGSASSGCAVGGFGSGAVGSLLPFAALLSLLGLSFLGLALRRRRRTALSGPPSR